MVHVPSNWDQDSSSGQPLVIGLHGYANTAEDFRSSFLMDDHSNANTYLAVYLQATYFKDPNSDNRISSWNGEDCGASPGPGGPTCNPFTVAAVPRPRKCDDSDGNKCNWFVVEYILYSLLYWTTLCRIGTIPTNNKSPRTLLTFASSTFNRPGKREDCG